MRVGGKGQAAAPGVSAIRSHARGDWHFADARAAISRDTLDSRERIPEFVGTNP